MMDDLNPFQSRIQHRLKQDAESIERRAWYSSHQQPIFRHYADLQTLRNEVHTVQAKEQQRQQSQDEKQRHDGHDAIPPEVEWKWLMPLRRPQPSAQLTVVGFPDSGCNYATFSSLADRMKGMSANIMGVCLPGRMQRVLEPPSCGLFDILKEVHRELMAALSQPSELVFIGQGFGAILAFEMVRLLSVEGVEVRLLIASGPSPVDLSMTNIEASRPVVRPKPVVANPSKVLLNASVARGVQDADLAERRDLLRIHLPVLLADHTLAQSYCLIPPLLPASSVRSQLSEGFLFADCAATLQDMGEHIYKIKANLILLGQEGSVESAPVVTEWKAVGWDALTHGSFDERIYSSGSAQFPLQEDAQEDIMDLLRQLLPSQEQYDDTDIKIVSTG